MIDPLLMWMSFRQHGHVHDLPPGLVGNTDGSRVLDNYSSLGHAEMSLARKKWRIAPPVLAELPASTRTREAVLCGARTPCLLKRLTTACSQEGGTLTVSEAATHPARVRIAATSRASLGAVGHAAGIPLQYNAAVALLTCTPAIREWPRKPCPMVEGNVKTVKRFSRSKAGWVPVTLAEATTSSWGFYKIHRDWDWVYLIKTGKSECARIDARAGRLLVCAKLPVVSWDDTNRTLCLPARLRPPHLITRALTLCSGLLPEFDIDHMRICFKNVPPAVLHLLLQITRLKLQ